MESKSRRAGSHHQAIISASEVISTGGVVFIASETENDYADRMASGIKLHSSVDVEIRRKTRLRPANSRELVFENSGELIGIEIVPQEQVFCGYEIRAKNLGKTSNP